MKTAFNSNKALSPGLFWGISIAFSFGFYFFPLIVFRIVQPDLDEHIVISENMFVDWHVPAHPLFYFLIQLFSFFTKNLTLEIWAAFLVFSLAQLLKIYASREVVEEIFGYKLTIFSYLVLVLCQLVISFSIFESHFIMNQMSPNYFHNGTLQLSIPFALLLFREAVRFQKSEGSYRILKILGFGLLVCLSKPSFLFCFIPLFPTYILFTRGIGRKLLGSLKILTLFSFIIIGQSLYLKLNPPNYVTSFKVLFLPFYQFGSFQSHLSMMFYGSFLILLGLLLEPRLRKEASFQFLIAMLFFAYVISFLFVDSINGNLYSNMTWQTTVILYLLLIVACGHIFQPQKVGFHWRQGLFLFALLANVGYTFIYFIYVIGMRTFFI